MPPPPFHGNRKLSSPLQPTSSVGSSRRASPMLLAKQPSPLIRSSGGGGSSDLRRMSLPTTTATSERHHHHHSSSSRERSDGDNCHAVTSKKQKKKGKSKATIQQQQTIVSGATSTSTPVLNDGALLHQLSAYFSKVELIFQLGMDRNPRTSLFPRDLGNLLLWAVPTPVPIVESPRIFFIKNKSKVRDVVVVYVNGWSYDQLMCTGVGLPRSSRRLSGETNSSVHKHAGVDDVSSDQRSDSAPQPGQKRSRGDENDTDGEGPSPLSFSLLSSSPSLAQAAAPWDEWLCSTMLRHVRHGQCWARDPPGVQYAPLFISSMKNTLEMDLFWRNDAPRLPRSSGAGANSNHSGNNSASMSGTTEAKGVSRVFKMALEIVSNNGSPVSEKPSGELPVKPGADARARTNAETEKEEAGVAKEAAQQQQTEEETQVEVEPLWDDRETLLQYALHLPQHGAELEALGFVMVVPMIAKKTPGEEEEPQEEGEELEEESDTEWKQFPPARAGTEARDVLPRIFAFDCEMVLVEGHVSALARATLVDVRTRETVMDWLVKPQVAIVNYLTRYSGIDEEMLRDVNTTLEDCQAELATYIDTDTFVVGHSLENDFKACKMLPNCYILDSAWLYPHPSGLPYKNALKFLANRYLNLRIQQGSHDSSIDATTSAALVHLKMVNGPYFGVRERVSVLGLIAAAGVGGSSASAQQGTDENPEKKQADNLSPVPIRIQLFDDATVLSTLLPKTSSSSMNIDAIPVRHDEDATRKVVRALRRSSAMPQPSVHAHETKVSEEGDAQDTRPFSLTWVQLTENHVDVVKPQRSAEQEAAQYSSEQVRKVEGTNSRVMRIVEACPEQALVLIVAGACAGEHTGNHFSKAQGVCFGFVKDSTAVGPVDGEELCVGPEEGGDGGAGSATAAQKLAGATPPACQQQ